MDDIQSGGSCEGMKIDAQNKGESSARQKVINE